MPEDLFRDERSQDDSADKQPVLLLDLNGRLKLIVARLFVLSSKGGSPSLHKASYSESDCAFSMASWMMHQGFR